MQTQSQEFLGQINETISGLQATISRESTVNFVIHFWKPFPNHSLDGLQFKCINSPEIPRATLIPIVSTPATLGASKINDNSGRVEAVEIKYTRPGYGYVTDLIQKFGVSSLVHVTGFDYDLNNVERALKLYDLLMAGLPENPNMEDIAQYFEISLPHEPKTVFKNRASQIVRQINGQGILDNNEMVKFSNMVSWVTRSVNMCVSLSVSPFNGRLPKALRHINGGKKFRLDETDNWIARQFPGFDTSSKLQSAKTNGMSDSIDRLADLLAGRLTSNQDDNKKMSLEELMARMTDAVPEAERPSNWDELPESEKTSIAQKWLNRVNNVTPQYDDVFGKSRDEINKRDNMMNDGTVHKDGKVVTETAAAVAAAENITSDTAVTPKAVDTSKSAEPDKAEQERAMQDAMLQSTTPKGPEDSDGSEASDSLASSGIDGVPFSSEPFVQCTATAASSGQQCTRKAVKDSDPPRCSLHPVT